jgi:hypothetical protein
MTEKPRYDEDNCRMHDYTAGDKRKIRRAISQILADINFSPRFHPGAVLAALEDDHGERLFRSKLKEAIWSFMCEFEDRGQEDGQI